jgi:hypothetical protein
MPPNPGPPGAFVLTVRYFPAPTAGVARPHFFVA